MAGRKVHARLDGKVTIAAFAGDDEFVGERGDRLQRVACGAQQYPERIVGIRERILRAQLPKVLQRGLERTQRKRDVAFEFGVVTRIIVEGEACCAAMNARDLPGSMRRTPFDRRVPCSRSARRVPGFICPARHRSLHEGPTLVPRLAPLPSFRRPVDGLQQKADTDVPPSLHIYDLRSAHSGRRWRERCSRSPK